jgi:hypothetical protein
METIGAIALVILAAAALAAWLPRRLSGPRGPARGTVSLLVSSFALRGAAAVALRASGTVQPKLADSIVSDIWAGLAAGDAGELLRHPNFAVQAAWVAPGFLVAGISDLAATVMNVLAMTIAAGELALAVAMLAGARAGRAVAVLMVAFPAALYWGNFSLRDPMIFLGTSLAAAAAVRAGAGSRWWLHAAAAAVLLGSLRPELLPVCAVLPVVMLAIRARRSFAARAALAVAAVAVAARVPALAERELGLSSIDLASVNEKATARLERSRRESGGGSSWNPATVAGTRDPAAQLGVRTIGVLAVPFPLAPRSGGDLGGAADSLAFLGTLGAAAVVSIGRARSRGLACATVPVALGAAALAGAVAYGTVVANAGNAFRLRLSLIPFAAAAAACATGIRPHPPLTASIHHGESEA